MSMFTCSIPRCKEGSVGMVADRFEVRCYNHAVQAAADRLEVEMKYLEALTDMDHPGQLKLVP
jgi:hypothetical protein